MRDSTRWFGIAAVAALGATLARRSRAGSFRDQVVLITGGARGLGLAMARELAPEHPRLVLMSRTIAELDRAAADLTARGASVRVIVADVRDRRRMSDAIESIVRRHGRLDVLINNAGVIQAMPFEHAQVEDFEDSLATHFWGPLFAIRAALPIMRRQGGGRIVNIASIGGRIGVPHLSPYCAGKFALVGLSEALHAEVAKDNIAVTTVTPGLMRTGSHRNVVVRGQRRREARWFGLASATPISSMSASRAARQIVAAIRANRARVTPGIQARAGELADALAPELVAAAMTMVANAVLPGPTEVDGDRGQKSRAIDLGWVESLLPSGAERRFNQPAAAGGMMPY
ncbi:MAG TPA: SDR family oxidoreductase [Vicinamibacterales bacterium]|nr:SDR family oxidoreductase [Vicinamibacterales bacterium]